MKLGEGNREIYSNSTLLQKVEKLGLEISGDLIKVAVVRGLRYYDVRNQGTQWKGDPRFQISVDDLSNAELAIALLSPSLPEGTASEIQMRQRIAAAVLSAPEVAVSDLTALAIRERCVPQTSKQWIRL